MTQEQKALFIRELAEKFVLIPRNRLWHFLGGAATFAVAAFALSFAGVLAGMKSSSAVQAANRIEEIRGEAEKKLMALQASDAYVRYNDQVTLFPHANSSKALAGWTGSGNTGIRPYNPNDADFKWTVRQPK